MGGTVEVRERLLPLSEWPPAINADFATRRQDERSPVVARPPAQVSASEPMSRPKPRVAILVVNGIGRRGRSAWVRRRDNTDQALKYPWIDLCLGQLERHSLGWDYQVSVFDNSHLALHRKLMRDHRHVRVEPGAWFSVGGHIVTLIPIRHAYRLFELSHPRALDYLARRVSADFEYIVTLDTDSFPIRDDWLDILVPACERPVRSCQWAMCASERSSSRRRILWPEAAARSRI